MTSFGSVYRRGRIWWVQYCHRGHVLRESSRSPNRADAREFLRARLGEMAAGQSPALLRETGFEELTNLLTLDYAINGRKSAADLSYRVAHLREHFGRLLASEISYDAMTRYISARMAEGAAPATVQHELACLGRMLTLAVRSRRLAVKPPIPTIKLHNARTGFFETEDVERVAQYLPECIAAVVRFAYLTGWRRSEVLGLEWRRVDDTAVRLEPGTTKNGEGRLFPLTEPLQELLRLRRARTSELERVTSRVIPLVFTWEDGRPIRCFQGAWDSALAQAGLPGRIFHDLRRSAVRRLVRAGVSETVAMRLSGHKTRAIFDRYNIVSTADLIEGARRAHEG
jgi:integrase